MSPTSLECDSVRAASNQNLSQFCNNFHQTLKLRSMALYWHYDLMQNYDLKILGCTEMFMNIAVCIAIECSADSSTKFSSHGGEKLRVFQDRIKSPNLAPS